MSIFTNSDILGNTLRTLLIPPNKWKLISQSSELLNSPYPYRSTITTKIFRTGGNHHNSKIDTVIDFACLFLQRYV